MIIPNYKDYVELYKKGGKFVTTTPFMEYEEYRKPYLDRWKEDRVVFIKHCILLCALFIFVVFAFFLPRPRGFRVNRKKRVIYWQTIFGSHAIAFVPNKVTC